MYLNCSNINFTGTVDKSVYDWAEYIKKEAPKSEILRSQKLRVKADMSQFENIGSEVDKIMQDLEQKASQMHPDTVIFADYTKDNKQNCYLQVRNDILKDIKPTAPCTGFAFTNGLIGGPGVKPLYTGQVGPVGRQYVDLLKKVVGDMKPGATDRLLYDHAVDELLDIAADGPSEKLSEKLAEIHAFRDSSNYKFSDAFGTIDERVAKEIDKWKNNQAIKEYNQRLLEQYSPPPETQKNIWQKFGDLFS